jgi:hypothetical protein
MEIACENRYSIPYTRIGAWQARVFPNLVVLEKGREPGLIAFSFSNNIRVWVHG